MTMDTFSADDSQLPGIISTPGVEEVTDRQRIVSLIEGLRLQRGLVCVQFGHSPVRFNSALLKIDAENQVAYLDELTPPSGHHRLRVGNQLRLSGIVHGVPLSGTVTVKDIGDHRGTAFYRVSLPELIEYRQKRSYYRVHIPRALNLSLTLCKANEEDTPHARTGRITDLSLGGVGVCLPETTLFTTYDAVTILELILPEDHPTLTCDGQIRWNKVRRKEKQVNLGIRFADLAPEQAETLKRVLIELQREELRKRLKG